jgi:hypothetical protein
MTSALISFQEELPEYVLVRQHLFIMTAPPNYGNGYSGVVWGRIELSKGAG